MALFGRHKPVPVHAKAGMVKAYLHGDTATAAAAKFGFCRRTCEKALREAGIVTRHTAHRESIREDVSQGMRKCYKCKIKQPVAEFHTNRRTKEACGSISGLCKNCYHARHSSNPRRIVPVLNLSAEQCAYLAGFTDGEGYIGLIRYTNKRGHTTHWANITISQCHEMICELQAEVGIGNIQRYERDPTRKPVYHWSMSANAIRALLPLIRPYLRVKHKQADLLLNYLSIAAHRTAKGKLSEEYRAEVSAIYTELKRLNKRGPI